MYHPTVNETIVHASNFHSGQVDTLGAPYYFHPMRVMMRLGPAAADAEKHAALLHDAIEDNPDVTPDRLRELGYSEDVLAMVALLTRPKTMAYPEFIDRIVGSCDLGAMRIKLADLYDNTNAERLSGAPDPIRRELADMEKSRYQPAIAKLKLALGERAGTVIAGNVPLPEMTVF